MILPARWIACARFTTAYCAFAYSVVRTVEFRGNAHGKIGIVTARPAPSCYLTPSYLLTETKKTTTASCGRVGWKIRYRPTFFIIHLFRVIGSAFLVIIDNLYRPVLGYGTVVNLPRTSLSWLTGSALDQNLNGTGLTEGVEQRGFGRARQRDGLVLAEHFDERQKWAVELADG